MADEKSAEYENADPIEVTYTATVRYEDWEVVDYGITEHAAIENLADIVGREPGNAGEFEVRRE